MRGFERVGTVAPDMFIDFDRAVPADGLLFYSYTGEPPMRSGFDRVRDVLRVRDGQREVWSLFLRSGCPLVDSGDHVFIATAIGESAFDPAPSAAAQ